MDEHEVPDELLLEIEAEPGDEIEITVEAYLPDDMDLSVFDHGDLSWQDDGLCREVGGDIFFPDKGGSARLAKEICGLCEVRTSCLEYALRLRPPVGVWGGTVRSERDAILAERESNAA